jgi:hypothetical protein
MICTTGIHQWEICYYTGALSLDLCVAVPVLNLITICITCVFV